MKLIPAMFMLGVLFAVPATTIAQEARSAGGKSLLEIVSKLESEGYGPIIEISSKKGRVEVEVFKDRTAHKLTVDPATGKTVSQLPGDGKRRPPANARKLSDILKDLEEQGYTQIQEVSFEKAHWEVGATNRERSKRELRVDPIAGTIASDRAND